MERCNKLKQALSGEKRYKSPLSSTSALDGGRRSTARPGRSTPEKRPGTHCRGGWVDIGVGLDGVGKSRLQLGFEHGTTQHVASRYTD